MDINILLIDIIIAYILDLIIGDPYWLPHPVRFIGWLVRISEKFLRAGITGADVEKKERRAGAALAFFVVSSVFILVFAILKAAELASPILFHILNIYFIYSALASTCLAVEAGKVYGALKEGDIVKARQCLGMLVGRQTEGLSEPEVIRGVVETTAENTVDGIVSPMIYAFAGSIFGIGAPLVYAFKAVSTLDSMVGYMNDKYINFGRVSAKLDDAANYIPARLSGVIMPVAAFLCGKSFLNSFRIMLRDRKNHKSPNCAYPEAAVAGALGVQLGGANIYFGKVVEKPTIGDAAKPLEANDIPDTIIIMYITSFLVLAAGMGLSFFILYFVRIK
ncbi:MAG: adenosylcobinamide-phosphate synthase CbiB [Clostridia bacterium]|nr:adenosylcobinamide-phosphate synthase CbiB [Clostridia bacterium]